MSAPPTQTQAAASSSTSSASLTPVTPTTTSTAATAPAINLDYLAPTLSAILAGIIHHAFREKKSLGWGDVFLIMSPSMPVICQIVLRTLASILTFIASIAQWDVSKITHYWSTPCSTTEDIPDKNMGMTKDGAVVFWKYTPTKTLAQKIVEWQQQDYTVSPWNAIHRITLIIQNITGIKDTLLVEQNAVSKKITWYYESVIDKTNICFYLTSGNCYVAQQGPVLTHAQIYRHFVPEEYKENTGSFRISKIHNEFSGEIMETVKKYKKGKKTTNLNFLFAGPPGTCKTYAARAIAAELGRTLVEIDLTRIETEEEFLEIFAKNNPTTTVFLLDELDLMCPSREMNDAVLKSVEMERLQKWGIQSSHSSKSPNISPNITIQNQNVSDNTSSSSEFDHSEHSNVMQNQINQHQLDQLNKKIDRILLFQDWVRYVLILIMRMCMFLVSLNSSSTLLAKNINKHNKTNQSDLTNWVFDLYKDIDTDVNLPCPQITDSSGKFISKTNSKPFTLKTLLTFISGGSTPEGLCICATTNRPECIDDALLRPGRLRLITFTYLRKCDAVQIIVDEYPDENIADIETGLSDISFQDYGCSGALLSAVLSSTVSLSKCFQVLERELVSFQDSPYVPQEGKLRLPFKPTPLY